jgi:hypothetical protein
MEKGFGRRLEAGSSVTLLLFLLAILVGAGAWNYRRNAAVEDEAYRPYRGYTDEAVEQLIDAYEDQRERSSKRFEAAASRRVNVEGKAYFGEQVQEFERVQGISQNTRALRDGIAESQTSLKLLREESSKRARERQKLRLFFERLFTMNF